MNHGRRRLAAGVLAVVAGVLAFAGPGRAAEASAWVAGAHSAARLLESKLPQPAEDPVGAPPSGALLLAGIEVRMDPGFITYWRDPGDAGVPPSFDFGASTNLLSAEVLYPAPRSLDEAGLKAFGYSGSVVFPILAKPLDPRKPLALAIRFDYAVCANICLPARADLRLTLDGRPSLESDRVTAALAAVPRRAQIGADGPLPRILAIRPDPGGPAGERYTVEALAGGNGGTLFVEAPEGWAFAAGAPLSRTEVPPTEPSVTMPPGAQRLLFPVKRLESPKGQLRPTTPVTLTLVTGSGATEVATRLDAAPATP